MAFQKFSRTRTKNLISDYFCGTADVWGSLGFQTPNQLNLVLAKNKSPLVTGTKDVSQEPYSTNIPRRILGGILALRSFFSVNFENEKFKTKLYCGKKAPICMLSNKLISKLLRK